MTLVPVAAARSSKNAVCIEDYRRHPSLVAYDPEDRVRDSVTLDRIVIAGLAMDRAVGRRRGFRRPACHDEDSLIRVGT
jgi:hypothetical protein